MGCSNDLKPTIRDYLISRGIPLKKLSIRVQKSKDDKYPRKFDSYVNITQLFTQVMDHCIKARDEDYVPKRLSNNDSIISNFSLSGPTELEPCKRHILVHASIVHETNTLEAHISCIDRHGSFRYDLTPFVNNLIQDMNDFIEEFFAINDRNIDELVMSDVLYGRYFS